MNLLISLRSEVLKTKRTAVFYFTLIGAAVVPLMFLLNVMTHGLPDENESSKDPLNSIFKLSTEITGLGILPLFIILVCTLLPQIEHRNNTWKQVLVSPKSKATIFAAKFINVHLLVLLFLVANHLFMWLIVVVTHYKIPELDVLYQPLNGYTVFAKLFNIYVALLAVGAIQFWLGLRFKNFVIPVAIGLALWLTGTLLALDRQTAFSAYFPYSFQIFPILPRYKPEVNQVAWTSVGYAVAFLFLGYTDFKRKRINA